MLTSVLSDSSRQVPITPPMTPRRLGTRASLRQQKLNQQKESPLPEKDEQQHPIPSQRARRRVAKQKLSEDEGPQEQNGETISSESVPVSPSNKPVPQVEPYEAVTKSVAFSDKVESISASSYDDIDSDAEKDLSGDQEEYATVTSDSQGETSSSSYSKRLTPLHHNIQPRKSILKQTTSSAGVSHTSNASSPASILGDIYLGSLDFSEYPNLDVIMNAACAELEKIGTSSSNTSVLQIYASLNTSLRHKNSSISTQLLLDNANSLALYAKRDLIAAEASSNTLDVRTVIQILRVVDYLFFSEDIAFQLDFELVKWFLNRGLDVLTDANSSKSVVAAYLHIFNYQRLPKPLTNDMALRLLNAVVARPTFSSTGIISEYITSHRLLIKTNPGVMIQNVQKWLPNIISALIDQPASIRQQALLVLQDCNQRLLHDRTIGKCLYQLFEKPMESNLEEGSDNIPESGVTETSTNDALDTNLRTYFDHFRIRLTELINTQGEGRMAMSIWRSVILLLLTWGPHPDHTVDKWHNMMQMLDLYKLGINSQFLSTRVATIHTWNTVIFIWTPQIFGDSSRVESKSISFLLHPFKLLKDNRPATVQALSQTLNAILLLSMKPTQSMNTHLDVHYTVVWDKIIEPLIQLYLDSSDIETRKRGLAVLHHLLTTPTNVKASNQSFKSTRVLLPDPVALSEVPAFPSKWIHANCARIFKFLQEKAIGKVPWETVTEITSSMINSCKLASQREIYTSTETMALIAAVCNFIHFCFTVPSSSLSPTNVEIFKFVESSIDSIGFLQFTEKSLEITRPSESPQVSGELFSSPQYIVSPRFRNNSMSLGSSRISPRKADPNKADTPVFHLWKMTMSKVKSLSEVQRPQFVAEFVLKFIHMTREHLIGFPKKVQFLTQIFPSAVENADVWGAICEQVLCEIMNANVTPSEDEWIQIIHLLSWPARCVFFYLFFCGLRIRIVC
ncbi:hypothetical protein AWJ20_3622 [Sugiyamaella lignohabitans]|uniref:Telomere-associated protein Rif1 N-terminal domain-containing protein n=1 Tax=Sugiyamaella lignohabitans TaxID=796027 RepID=A0A170QYC6_9ASCO|nr:uncharacterized protein AWJ20_3622 [Sugiyamaella lignohabitans]ANB15973.1 hypothetical protein AWJ20_3622 [Sugiyamaella lignohabitans]